MPLARLNLSAMCSHTSGIGLRQPSNAKGSCFCPGETRLHLPWRIRLRFYNHAPQHLARRLAFHQLAADEVGSNLLGGAGEEGLGEGWEALDRRGGYGSGLGEEVLQDTDGAWRMG